MIEFLIFLGFIISFIWLITQCFAAFSVTDCKLIALNTKMVGAGHSGYINMLARVSMVNRYGKVIYDEYVRPVAPVTNYRTRWSGIRKRNLVGAKDFLSVRQEVAEILEGCILVGHDLEFDLGILKLIHPVKDIRDSAHYKPFRQSTSNRSFLSMWSRNCRMLKEPGGNIEEFLRWEATIDCDTLQVEEKPSLKFLAKKLLSKDIQVGEHCSVEDARTAMDLYLLVEKQWERELDSYK